MAATINSQLDLKPIVGRLSVTSDVSVISTPEPADAERSSTTFCFVHEIPLFLDKLEKEYVKGVTDEKELPGLPGLPGIKFYFGFVKQRGEESKMNVRDMKHCVFVCISSLGSNKSSCTSVLVSTRVSVESDVKPCKTFEFCPAKYLSRISGGFVNSWDSKVFMLDEIIGYLCSDGRLRIKLELKVYDYNLSGKYFRELLEYKHHADFKIKVGDCILSVHKCVLTARSPVLAKMLSSNFAEVSDGIMEIKDFSEDAVIAMVQHFYSDPLNFSKNTETAQECLQLADIYDLDDLKNSCCHSLKDAVNAENFTSLFLLSDSAQAPDLKKVCQKFSLSYEFRKDVLESEDWKNFKKNHADLAVDILEFVTKDKWPIIPQ